MTATLISLISILAGILGANTFGLGFKRYTFGLVGNTIAGVFGGILFIKLFGRIGCDPLAIIEAGNTNWVLFFLNLATSFAGGVSSIILVKTIQEEMEPNNTDNSKMIDLFKVTSLLEGVSYILLLFVGVPLKYLAGNAILVKALGMPHGILFIAYVVLALVIRSKMKWDSKSTFIVLLASLIPLGTFYVNRKFFGEG